MKNYFHLLPAIFNQETKKSKNLFKKNRMEIATLLSLVASPRELGRAKKCGPSGVGRVWLPGLSVFWRPGGNTENRRERKLLEVFSRS